MSYQTYFIKKTYQKIDFDLENGYYKKKDNNNVKIAYPDNIKESSSTIDALKYEDTESVLIFSIRRFYKLKSDSSRIHVVVYSSNEKTNDFTRFECYTSVSDGSFWRFCVKADREERYDKGYNYISSTFINIYLQKYINESMQKFNIVTLNESNIQCIKTSELNTFLRERIIGNEYVSGNEFFSIMNDVFPPVTYVQNYRQCLSTLLTKLATYTNNDNLTEIDICSDIFCALKTESLNKHITLTNETSRREFFNKIKNVFSSLFLKYFAIHISSKRIIYEKTFNVGGYVFVGKTYSVEIEYKLIPGKIYMLYYMIYSGSLFRDKKIKTFIHIIPKFNRDKPNKITAYGLDERYVVAGVLINKVFDYKTQTNITKLKTHDERITPDYRFIGDLTNYEFLPE